MKKTIKRLIGRILLGKQVYSDYNYQFYWGDGDEEYDTFNVSGFRKEIIESISKI